MAISSLPKHAKWKPASSLVKADERRLVLRMFNYWDTKRGARNYPALSDVCADEIADLWPWCFVLEPGYSFPYFNCLGKELVKYSGIFLSGAEDWHKTILDKAVEGFSEVLKSGEPLVVEDELRRFDQKLILFRAIMLPLSDDNATINYVLGAANGKLAEDL